MFFNQGKRNVWNELNLQMRSDLQETKVEIRNQCEIKGLKGAIGRKCRRLCASASSRYVTTFPLMGL